MKDEISLQDLLRLSISSIWRNKLVIGAATILFLLVGILYASVQSVTNIYYAKATITSAIYGSYQDSVTVSNAMENYSGVLTSRKVCERAEALIGDSKISADYIMSMIESSINGSSTIMSVYAYSSDPKTCVLVANAVAEAFVIEIQGITGSDAIQILDASQTAHISADGYMSLIKKIMMMAAAGFVLSCLYFICLEIFSTKVKTIEQCSGPEGDELLGVIPMYDINDKK